MRKYWQEYATEQMTEVERLRWMKRAAKAWDESLGFGALRDAKSIITDILVGLGPDGKKVE
jgi:hypothetical protein